MARRPRGARTGNRIKVRIILKVPHLVHTAEPKALRSQRECRTRVDPQRWAAHAAGGSEPAGILVCRTVCEDFAVHVVELDKAGPPVVSASA